MQLVADAAGVAVQTVYFMFGTKATLLAEVEDRVVLGDAPSEQWRQRPWMAQMQQEIDPQKLLTLFVEVDTDIKSRIAPLAAALGPERPVDPRAAIHDRGRDDFFGTVVDRLQALGALRDGMTASRALDIIRVVNTVDAFVDLTTRRGWTTAEWKQWMTHLLSMQLLLEPLAHAKVLPAEIDPEEVRSAGTDAIHRRRVTLEGRNPRDLR